MDNLENKAKLAKAVIGVMSELVGVEKNMTVGSGKNSYKGVSDKDVKDNIRPLMIKHGLCILPISTDETNTVDFYDAPNQYSGGVDRKMRVFTSVSTKYLLLHTSGESVTLSGSGHGVDTQDKAAGKATTYALKYTLLYTFMVSVGAIDDADRVHSDDIENVQKPIPQPTKPAAPSNANKPLMTKAQKEAAKAAYAKGDAKGKEAVLAHMKNFTHTEDDLKYVKG